MGEVISTVTQVVTAAIGWTTSFGQMIVDTPILLIFVVVPLVGLGIGIFRRLMNVN